MLLVAGAVAVAGVARRLNWSAPLLLVVAGLAASFLPGMDQYLLDPDLVLFFVLPPLLFAAAWESSFVNLRSNMRAVLLLSVGLVLFTVLAVGLTAHAAIRGLPMVAALALGAIVAPPDAVAATAVARAVGLPRRMVVILAGESLFNDATALTAYRAAVEAAHGEFSVWAGVRGFAVAVAGGALVGYALALGVQWLLLRMRDPLLENTLLLLAPFVGYGAAEKAHASGVLAVVVAGLYLGHHAPRRSTYATRLQGAAVWRMIGFLLETVVFALIGLQLRTVLDHLGGQWSAAELVWAATVVLGVVILVRFVWVYPATYLPRRLSRRVRRRDPSPPWTYPTVLGWAGMRGVVSLAAAFALPPDFPQRDLLLFLTFVVVIGTLVIQGFTLPALIRRLRVTAEDERQDALAEAAAQHAAANAALERLNELVDEDDAIPGEVVQRLREKAEIRQLGAWERLGGGRTGPGYSETPTASYRRLRRDMLEAERAVFVRLRDTGQIDDEVLRRVQQELDFEEAMLVRE
jgi:CPA1 family monovalent cation:H+ antiporter